MTIVEDKEQLQLIYEELKVSDSFFLLIPENPFDNSPFNGISVLFIYLFQYEKTYCLINTHPDFEFTLNLHTFFNNIDTNKSIFVYNKKLFLSFIKNEKEVLKSNFIDANFVSYITENKQLITNEVSSITNVYKKFLGSFANKAINQAIPINSHHEYFEMVLAEIYRIYNTYKLLLFNSKDLLITLDNYYTNNYYNFERNGIYVDYHKLKRYNKNVFIKNNLIYSNYEFFTKTGRPTNAFCKLNMLALDKKTGIRKIFTSRFKDNGLLYQFDYSAFHLKLIAILIGDFTETDSFHKYLGNKIYPKLDLEDENNYNKIKTILFQQIYGGISRDYLHIPYFNKLTKFIDNLWDEYIKNDHIKTKLFKRNIYKKWFKGQSMNKLTLFNYYIQSFESEFCAYIIKDINTYIQDNKLQSEFVLYTYDSFLFDMHNDELQHLPKLKDIITYDNFFQVSMNYGNNYQELKSFKI